MLTLRQQCSSRLLGTAAAAARYSGNSCRRIGVSSLQKFGSVPSAWRPQEKLSFCRVSLSKMSVFTQQLNPITGKMEWGIQPQDYDYKQEVARSAYADMLHDTERNDKYHEGLKQSVKLLREQGKEVHVLDIGTGTGLLSMMAVACGADTVTACEAFYPMAECARKVLIANGCGDKVRLIPKRSTEIEVGSGKDMEHRANLLVTEVFDTELIGEGGIETFRHAKEVLLTEDALIVPSEATVYAQVVDSDMMQRWNKISPVFSSKGKLLSVVPRIIRECPGAAAVHDLQLSQVPRNWFTPLSEPLPVFWFDWSGRKKAISCDETTYVKFQSLAVGKCDAVLMWWDLKMDQEGEVMLSCAPYWAHPDVKGKLASSEDIPWRDHWMQAVYYLPTSVPVTEGQDLALVSCHDEYSLWFNIRHEDSIPVNEERPVCECGLHIVSSRTRLGQLNDPARLSVFVRLLEEFIKPDSVCLMLGDGCLMGIAAAKLGARHVYIPEGNEATRRILYGIVKENGVENCVTILPTDVSDLQPEELLAPATVVFSEPFFTTSLLPWHSLYCWYLRNNASHLIHPEAVILPHSLTIWGVPVQYRDLWKIQAPLHECNGFNLEIFDKLIESACEEADEKVEPQPLWEYPAKALAHPSPMLTINLLDMVPDLPMKGSGTFSLTGSGTLNGMALWVEWKMTNRAEDIISTGPSQPIAVGQNIKWDIYSRQGVYLFRNKISVEPTTPQKLDFTIMFKPDDGTMAFDFEAEGLGKSC